MSDENKFWISINAIVAAAVICITFSILSYWKDHNSKVVALIESGVNPVAVKCALEDDHGNMPVCLVLAAKTTAD